MTLPQAVASCFSKYASFQGRASRSEYWWFGVFAIIALVILGVVFAVLEAADIPGAFVVGILLVLFVLGLILPGIAVTVRRLHDVDKGGGWYFIQFIPYVGFIWFMYLMVQPGTVRDPAPGPNRFGDRLS
jgi:uncharacterized membrane protein YhaH (DUF805 family)